MELLEHLAKWKGRASSQWKSRANANQAGIEKGDPFEYAQIYKSLVRLEAEGALRAADRAHLHQSLEFLVEEVAHALDTSREEARDLIAEAAAK